MTRTSNTQTPQPVSNTAAPRRRTRTSKVESSTDKRDWTIVSALDFVLQQAHESELNDSLWTTCEDALAYLRGELNLTNMQIVTVAMLIDAGQPLSFKNFASYLKCSRLKVMIYSDEIDALIEKRWAHIERTRNDNVQGYALEPGVVTALRRNKPFIPEKIDGLTDAQFYERVQRHLNLGIHHMQHDFEEEEKYIQRLAKANPQLEVVKAATLFIDGMHDLVAWLMIVNDYIEWNNTPDEGLLSDSIGDNFPDEFETDYLRDCLQDGTHIMYSLGMIEMRCEDGLADNTRYLLTNQMKHLLFPDSSLLRKKRKKRSRRANDLKQSKDIKEKVLFYNPAEGEKMSKLSSLLSQEQLPQVQARLEEQGMRKGFACLLYGGPGVGKTESVYQIARQTGRDLMQVNIAGMRDKYVGESEKNIKQVFNRYRELCQDCKVMPILFFNEADAIFGKRTTFGGNNPSVEKMDNAMQNIILQEMEDLDGILIATTNLTDNLDAAFERRFLFKVEFHNPNVEIKEKIWTSMVSEISSEDAHELATRYDLSPGQIENVARKKTIDYIINGEQPTLERLSAYCQDEQLASKTKAKPVAGFR